MKKMSTRHKVNHPPGAGLLCEMSLTGRKNGREGRIGGRKKGREGTYNGGDHDFHRVFFQNVHTVRQSEYVAGHHLPDRDAHFQIGLLQRSQGSAVEGDKKCIDKLKECEDRDRGRSESTRVMMLSATMNHYSVIQFFTSLHHTAFYVITLLTLNSMVRMPPRLRFGRDPAPPLLLSDALTRYCFEAWLIFLRSSTDTVRPSPVVWTPEPGTNWH